MVGAGPLSYSDRFRSCSPRLAGVFLSPDWVISVFAGSIRGFMRGWLVGASPHGGRAAAGPGAGPWWIAALLRLPSGYGGLRPAPDRPDGVTGRFSRFCPRDELSG